MLRAQGVRLGAIVDNGAIAPFDILVGCDLRGCRFDGADLTGVSFLGCFLSGASLRGARLNRARFVGCFAPESWNAVDLRDASLESATLRACELRYLGDLLPTPERWPEAAVAAAMGLVKEDPRERHAATNRLGGLSFAPASFLLAYALEDSEWDIRLSALRSLATLRGAGFPDEDSILLEWMFYALGDENSNVREHMIDSISELKPNDSILRAAIAQLTSSKPVDQLAGLRAGESLLHADASYARLVDIAAVERLAVESETEVRQAAMHFAGYLSGEAGLKIVLVGAKDGDPSVRAAALGAVSMLDSPPYALQIANLLLDESEAVRTAAVYALNQCPDFSPGLLTNASHDRSEAVRAAVATVLADRRNSP